MNKGFLDIAASIPFMLVHTSHMTTEMVKARRLYTIFCKRSYYYESSYVCNRGLQFFSKGHISYCITQQFEGQTSYVMLLFWDKLHSTK